MTIFYRRGEGAMPPLPPPPPAPSGSATAYCDYEDISIISALAIY